jgi:plastocyanin
VFSHRLRFLITSGLLGVALAAMPALAAAQEGPVPQAMVEVTPTDINTWGFAAVVPVGGTITWTNLGAQAHTVTSVDGLFDSGMVAPGESTTLQFDTAGTFAYVCTPHPWMKGFISVSDTAPSAATMAMVEGNPSDINSWGFAASVPAGGSVWWSNQGAQAHTATSTDGVFDTGMVVPGESGTVVFDTPGLYTYVCTPHPWMKGNVAVR